MVVRERLLMKKIKKREEKKRELNKKNKSQPEPEEATGKFGFPCFANFQLQRVFVSAEDNGFEVEAAVEEPTTSAQANKKRKPKQQVENSES